MSYEQIIQLAHTIVSCPSIVDWELNERVIPASSIILSGYLVRSCILGAHSRER